jgi:hypothetical protein
MNVKIWLLYAGKLILAGVVFEAGIVVGGMIAKLLNLSVPVPPQGADMNTIALYSLLTTPLLALGLALLARHLAGNFLTRALMLGLFMWVAYGVNTQLEAAIVSSYAKSLPYAVVMDLVAALLCGAAVTFLFRPEESTKDLGVAVKEFFAKRSALDWAWRIPLAALAFMPIYFVFGLMVLPFTGDYYRQSMFGLVMPTLDQLLPTLFTRSVLFLLVCLPIVILWQASNRALFWRLGLALFLLVGFVIMLYATWLPVYVRFPHTLEIFADEFVFAGVLVLLMARRDGMSRRAAQGLVRPKPQAM